MFSGPLECDKIKNVLRYMFEIGVMKNDKQLSMAYMYFLFGWKLLGHPLLFLFLFYFICSNYYCLTAGISLSYECKTDNLDIEKTLSSVSNTINTINALWLLKNVLLWLLKNVLLYSISSLDYKTMNQPFILHPKELLVSISKQIFAGGPTLAFFVMFILIYVYN